MVSLSSENDPSGLRTESLVTLVCVGPLFGWITSWRFRFATRRRFVLFVSHIQQHRNVSVVFTSLRCIPGEHTIDHEDLYSNQVHLWSFTLVHRSAVTFDSRTCQSEPHRTVGKAWQQTIHDQTMNNRQSFQWALLDRSQKIYLSAYRYFSRQKTTRSP